MVATSQTAGLGTKYGLLFSDTARIEKRHRYSMLLSAPAREPGINYREAYVYDGQNLALQFRGTGSGNLGASTLNHGFLYGPAVDQILADQTTAYGAGWDARWPLADNLGTIRDVVKYTPPDGSGGGDTTTIVDHLRYDAFGKITTQTNSAEQPRFTYTARELDSDTGLYYYRARWYDAATGKFMSEDPIDFAGGDENLYRYVGNGAVNAVDPTGLWQLQPEMKRKSGKVVYKADSKVDTLRSLSRLVTGRDGTATEADWVSIWPSAGKEQEKLWSDYPTAKVGACANVDNLIKGRWHVKQAVIVQVNANQNDQFLESVRMLLSSETGWHLSRWSFASQAVQAIRAAAGTGEHPIENLIIAGHGAAGATFVGQRDRSRPFAVGDLLSLSDPLKNDTNTYDVAKEGHGPPRSWFTRDAKVWVIGCFTSAFAEAFAKQNLRQGAEAFGTSAEVTGWYETVRGMKQFAVTIDGKRRYWTIPGLLNSDGWAGGTLGGSSPLCARPHSFYSEWSARLEKETE
ncbi:MAG: RHS repeat-associated core domain-containing protein [Pirellulales bacterium]